MKNVLLVLLFSASLLNAQEVVAKKDCAKVTASFKMMSEGTRINHKNITMYVKILDSISTKKEEKNRARKFIEDMNKKTRDRALNSQYPEMYEEMKKTYIVNCSSFTAENNATISGLIDRSIDFNNIMVKVLGDELSLSKVK